jgi:uncharacterized protein YhaN
MRIDRLDLLAYGPFTETILDLSEGASGLHLIYGDNEAGKSTSLRALIGWLFGIPARTEDNFLHDNAQLRIGGRLKLSNGEALEFIRRKGNKGTLLDPRTGETLDDSVLEPFLPGGIDENIFKKFYGIDHFRLVEGGRELLNQSGDLGQALFSAATGTAGLRQLLSDLRSGAEALYKPRASTKIVNLAIAGFKDAKRRMKEASVPVAEWKRLQKELSETVAAIEQVEKEIAIKSKEKSRLDRFNRVKGALAERRAIMERIEALGEVSLLPEDFGEKFKFAQSKLQAFRENKAKAESRLARLREESGKIAVRPELLNHEEMILALYKEIGAVEKAMQDRPRQDAKRRLLRSDAEHLLKAVRPDLALDDADRLRPLTNHKKWIVDLARRYGLLEQKRQNTENALRQFEEEKAALTKELGLQAVSSLDLDQLKAAVGAARKAGDVEKRLADVQKRASEDSTSCQSEFSRLGRFHGRIDELLNMAMPLPEILDTFEKTFDELFDAAKNLDRLRRDLSDELQRVEQDLNALLLRSDAPTTKELEEARTVRNTGWELIKRRYIEKLDAEEEIALYANKISLPAVYEQNVGDADHIADQLRLAADQVVKRADFEARKKGLKSRIETAMDESGKVETRRMVLEKEWGKVWEQLDIEPGSPREMKQWLLKVEQLLGNVRSARLVSVEAGNLSAYCKSLRESIAAQIATFDENTDPGEMSLETMIGLCEQKIEQVDEAFEKKRQLEHSLGRLLRDIKKAREDFESIQKDRVAWSQEWAQAIAGLGLEADAHPERATEVFEQLLAFFEKYDKSEESRRRIYGIDQVARQFEEKVSAFANSIGFETKEQNAADIAAQLNRELTEAREARASLRKLEAQEKETREEIEDAEVAIRAAHEQIVGLHEQASVKTDEELEAAWERSRTMRALNEHLQTVERELTRNGDGLSLRELEMEAVELDSDTIGQELERISMDLEEMQASRDKLRDRRQVVQNEISAKDGSDAAAEASEEAEQHLADMTSGIEQYLRLQIASLILEQRIEEYRKKNQAPVLARAGELFARLTLGSFVNLRDELNERGIPILLGVRQNEMEITIDQMSDGTRDQLYLALRLATLEQHTQKGEPMPFVVDDILIGFDDNRTAVCLEVLADIAAATQVLVFTHHQRVVELAEALQAPAGVFPHMLPR